MTTFSAIMKTLFYLSLQILILIQVFPHPFIVALTRSEYELKTIVISSRARAHELQEIKNQLNKFNLSFEVVASIEFHHNPLAPTKLLDAPKDVQLHQQTRLDLKLAEHVLKRRRDLNWEKISRWQNHLQIYLDIAYGDRLTDLGPFLILEDLALISEKTVALLNPNFLLDTLPKDWDMFIIDHFMHNCFENPFTHEDMILSLPVSNSTKSDICKVRSAYGIHAYLIKDTDAAVKLVHALNTRVPQVSDVSLSRLFERKKLNAYTTVEKLAVPKVDRLITP